MPSASIWTGTVAVRACDSNATKCCWAPSWRLRSTRRREGFATPRADAQGPEDSRLPLVSSVALGAPATTIPCDIALCDCGRNRPCYSRPRQGDGHGRGGHRQRPAHFQRCFVARILNRRDSLLVRGALKRHSAPGITPKNCHRTL